MPSLLSPALTPIEAAIFDVDGTLVSDLLHWRKHDHVLAELAGSDRLAISKEEWQRIRGLSDADAYPYFIAKAKAHGVATDHFPDLATYIEMLNDYFFSHIATLECRDGATAILATVKELGLITGVATNADLAETNRKLEAVHLNDQFRFYSCLDGTVAPKPAPDLFLRAVREASDLAGHALDPSETVVIEDSITGTTGALRAGCQVIWWQPESPLPLLLPSDPALKLDRLTIVHSAAEAIEKIYALAATEEPERRRCAT